MGSYRAPTEHFTDKLFLVAEDEPMIALDLESCLMDLGARVVIAETVPRALAAVRSERFDGATLDLFLNGVSIEPVIDVLVKQEVKFILATAQLTLPRPLQNYPAIIKPFTVMSIQKGLVDLFESTPDQL